MPPVVRGWGEEQKVIGKTGWGGLNPLRGPSAALTAPPECNAQALRLQEKRRAKAELRRSFQCDELAKVWPMRLQLANVWPPDRSFSDAAALRNIGSGPPAWRIDLSYHAPEEYRS